jgi:hypothetical protein
MDFEEDYNQEDSGAEGLANDDLSLPKGIHAILSVKNTLVTTFCQQR